MPVDAAWLTLIFPCARVAAAVELPYPDNTLGWEVSMVIAYGVCDVARLYQGARVACCACARVANRHRPTRARCAGWKGNLTEQPGSTIMFIVFSIIVATGNVYFFMWQVFV
jgi:hypothetical protein